jgi:iron(III) transport system substrate-binding protein
MPLPSRSGVRRLLAVGLVAALGAAVLAGCSSDGGEEVTIYSGRTEDLIGPLLQRFAEETGIDVNVRYGDSADLALLIAEEGDKSPADVFLSQSPGAVGFLDQKGLLGALPDDVLELVSPEVRADDGH